MLEKFINNIMDIPRVEGLAIFNRQGAVLLKRMPSFFLDELFADLGRRIVAMAETVDENFIPCDEYLLKYAGKWILLRRTERMFLFLLCAEEVNVMSLKMVTNMAFKNLKPEMLPPPIVMAVSAKPGAAPAAAPAATSAQGPQAVAKLPDAPRRAYRGQVF
jgi:hypothetical protein